ncbi:MAPEG family protein [Asticcacaulis excentricus]|nr:MAPEG family protein [Asticcacaulis excentricus]
MVAPLLALIAWSLIVLVWLYARRIPAMLQLGQDFQVFADKRHLFRLPADVRAVADNYTHLTEQPTLFYALSLGIQVSGLADQLFVVLAWIYVLLRIVHSLVQGIGNHVILRFCVFAASTGILAYMTLRAIRLVFDF